jgi:hypothetical protein
MSAHGNTDRSFTQSFGALHKRQGNERRETRLRYRARFSIFWDEQYENSRYAKAVSNEVSEHGLSLETQESIPVGTRVSLRSESGALFGGASVKHSTRRGLGYVVGLELSYSVLDDALALVREVYSTPRAK